MIATSKRVALAALVLFGALNGAVLSDAYSTGQTGLVAGEAVLTLFMAFWAAIVPTD